MISMSLGLDLEHKQTEVEYSHLPRSDKRATTPLVAPQTVRSCSQTAYILPQAPESSFPTLFEKKKMFVTLNECCAQQRN
jgi:hypothetical protein